MAKRALIGWMLAPWLLFPTAAPAQDLQATPVNRAPFNETVHLDGLIEAVQQSTVSAKTSGTVVELPFDVDDSVAAGDLIVRLEDSQDQPRLRQVRLGVRENDRLEVLAGLSEGERVVTNPDELVGSERLSPSENARAEGE